MKKIFYSLIILISISCISQDDKISIANTKWEYKVAENCVNVYDFKQDSTFTFYSCEMQDDFYGTYHFNNDTLVIIQKGSKYDEVLPENSIHRAEKKRYKVIIKDDGLEHVSLSDWSDNKWIKSDFKFDKNYLYTKVE